MKKLLFAVCALFGFIACTQNHIEEQSAVRTDAPETIKVGFEDGETRIQLNSAQKTVWTKNDLVSVFYRSDANQKWQYQGETGERVGNLKRVDNAQGTTTTTKTIVVYPYSENYWLNTDSYAIEATLPTTQYYAEGSYGVGSNLMVSRSEFTQFSLKSVCGWLKLQLTGDGEVVKSIKFHGNDGEQVAGLIYVDTETAEATLAAEMGGSDDNNAGGNLIFDDTILTEVTLDCGEGVTLGKNATAFYISLPPQTFENGFTVDIEDNSGYVMTQSTSKQLVIARNTIQPMSVVEFVNPNTPTTPTPANNEIWYTATELVEPYFDDVFGSTIISNNFDPETGKGILTFDGDVTSVGDDAFNGCNKLVSITIPDSVTAIGNSAFYYCSILTSITIPDSVTTIGGSAFQNCGSLTSVTIPNSVTTIGRSAFSGCSSLTSVTIGDSVTTIGDSVFSGCSSLTSVTIGDSVTSIGYYAFDDCSSLTSVTIGDSVTAIGDCAFYGCRSLTEFNGKYASEDGRCLIIDGTLTSFAQAGFTEYTIPDSVTSIGDWAFDDCSSLTSVTIPDSVTTIGNGAFCDCLSLTSITIPDSVTTIGNYAFRNCSSLTSITIPDSVSTIGDYAFEYCSSLKKVYCNAAFPPSIGSSVFTNNASGRKIYVYEESVDLYKSKWSTYKSSIVSNGKNSSISTIITYTSSDGAIVTSAYLPIISNSYENGVGTMVVGGVTIPNYAFSGCSSLTSVTIPDSVTTIGERAFYGCRSLTSVTIPDSVTIIGTDAFRNCSSLTSVTIPDSVTTIGEDAFQSCSSLTSVYISDLSAWCKIDFGNYAANPLNYAKNLYLNDELVTDLVIPSDIKEIKPRVFYSCSSLTSITIPDSVTTIGDYAFSGCSSLTSVTIPDSVTTIGYEAFYGCRSLTSITIPDSVTLIGNYAFYYCTSLTSVYCKATTPPAGGSSMFSSNGSGRKIYVPMESVEAYKSASYWRDYASDIVGYDFELG